MNKISFHDLKVSGLKNKKLVKSFITRLFSEEKKTFQQLDVIFCSDPYLLDLNKKFLNHDYYTDTMTFPISQDPLVGEIYISVDRVRENSKKLKINYKEELLRVLIHSCLHLCGYTDDSQSNIRIMYKQQEKYIKELTCFT